VSQENVELTLLALDAWNRRDLEAVIALIDAEGVGHPAFEGITEGRTWRGHAGMRQYFEDLAEFSTESHAEYPEIHDLGDRVLGLGRVWFGFAGGVDLDREAGFLFRWRNGKWVECRAWVGGRRSRRRPRSRRSAGVGIPPLWTKSGDS
jgi:ketosteroid isomerase-like protein